MSAATPGAVPVKQFMTRDPITARPDQPVLEAVALMMERGFKQVPIVDGGGRLVGMVSGEDVREAIGDPDGALHRELAELEELPISMVMSTAPDSVGEDTPLAEVAHHLADEAAGALPVVDADHRLVGVVSYVDVVRKLLDLATALQWPAEGPHVS